MLQIDLVDKAKSRIFNYSMNVTGRKKNVKRRKTLATNRKEGKI